MEVFKEVTSFTQTPLGYAVHWRDSGTCKHLSPLMDLISTLTANSSCTKAPASGSRGYYCCCSVANSCPTVETPQTPTMPLCPWDSPGKNTREDCHFLLQEIFLTQGSNPCLLHCQGYSLPLYHLGIPSAINMKTLNFIHSFTRSFFYLFIE